MIYQREHRSKPQRCFIFAGALGLTAILFLTLAFLDVIGGYLALSVNVSFLEGFRGARDHETIPDPEPAGGSAGAVHVLDPGYFVGNPGGSFERFEAAREVDEREPITVPELDEYIGRDPLETDGDYLFSLEDLDTIPVPLVQKTPRYPHELKVRRIESRVVCILSVDERGDVYRVEIERSEYPEFAESVVDAVLQWKFLPGRKTGQPVKFRLRLPVWFSLISEQQRRTGVKPSLAAYAL